MSFAIVSDTASDIETTFKEKENIEQVPTVIIFGENETYRDTEITQEEFFAKLETGQLAKTSQPSLEDFDKIFRDAGSKMESKQVLAIHISSKLSGTYNSARLSAEQIEEYDIRVFDTLNVSVGSGYFVYLAAYLREQGKSIDETLILLETARSLIHIEVYIERIDHLKRSGRINMGQYGLLKLIGLKPIINCEDGLLIKKGVVRGKKSALRKIGRRIRNKSRDLDNPVLIIGHANTPEVLDQLSEQINEINKSKLIQVGICNTLVVHTGPEPFGIGIAPSFESFM